MEYLVKSKPLKYRVRYRISGIVLEADNLKTLYDLVRSDRRLGDTEPVEFAKILTDDGKRCYKRIDLKL